MRMLMIAAAAACLGACGGADQEAAAETTAAALEPGEYALAWSNLKMNSSDKSDAGATADVALFATRACIAAGGKIEPAAFAQKDDECHFVNSYVRNGLLNVQLSCERDGKGKVSKIVSGSFKAQSFDGNVETSTSFDEAPNYTMTARVSGKRVGACAPVETAAKES